MFYHNKSKKNMKLYKGGIYNSQVFSNYFSGWCFNAYTLAAGNGFNIQFTAVSQNANSESYY